MAAGVFPFILFLVDPFLSSPEGTWEFHKKAFRDGNLALLRKTVIRKGHPLVKIFNSLSTAKRQKLVNEMKSIEQITRMKKSSIQDT